MGGEVSAAVRRRGGRIFPEEGGGPRYENDAQKGNARTHHVATGPRLSQNQQPQQGCEEGTDAQSTAQSKAQTKQTNRPSQSGAHETTEQEQSRTGR